MSRCLNVLALATLAQAIDFRPPALPLFTTDPFMQTWIRGDNSTSDVVTHWDGQKKELMAIARVDGEPYRLLGACAQTGRPVGASGSYQQGVDCSGDDLAVCGGGGCAMPDSATHVSCEGMCNTTLGCTGYVWTAKGCDPMSKAHNVCWLKGNECTIRSQSTCRNYRYLGTPGPSTTCPPTALQLRVSAGPTRTVFELNVADKVFVNMTFLSTMFADDYVRLSRPVYYLTYSVASADGQAHAVSVYTDASAEHTVNDPMTEQVQWSTWTAAGLHGVKIGSEAQNVLGLKGDRVNINWGYLYMAATGTADVWAGSLKQSRATFASAGLAPPDPDTRQPRLASDDLPGISTVVVLGRVLKPVEHVTILAYDDIASVYYFGSQYKGFWTQSYATIADAMAAAITEYPAMRTRSIAHDDALLSNLTAAGGEKYAAVSGLAYRQTLAATKLVWNHDRSKMWNFLKEISTNGDMQTMDVIFPGSPMLLYTNPNLLKLLLIPVLAYANNETYISFTDPYSPHQLGTYPIANDTTARQEPMPLENSGNMILMLLALIQLDPKHDTDFLLPDYYHMVQMWADEMILKLPFPANQICTDDFTGPLANNSNLGAKGIVALQAFSEICRFIPPSVGTNCDMYSKTAEAYAQVWMKYAAAGDHYKIAYGWNSSSWSIKYNLVWQKLLKLDGPFPYDDVVTKAEVPFYLKQANAFGIPMDLRHTYVKTDWLSWAAVMGNDPSSFGLVMDYIFKFANETPTRVPLTDLYDTVTGAASRGGFIARPVMGGIFAKMLTV